MKKILVIEDDRVLRETIREILTNENFEVYDAANGQEGLAMHRIFNFDLVITDILMPEMDGLEVIMMLKKTCPATKIIAMSGGGRVSAKDYLKVASEFGSNDTLLKPFSNIEFVDKVNAVLNVNTH
jgi:DNA-binding response OmpR family regulator